MTTILKRTTAIAALVALPLAPMAAQAQSQSQQSSGQQTPTQSNQQGQSNQQSQKADQGQKSDEQSQAGKQQGQNKGEVGQAQAGQQANMLVAKVGETEIRRSDVLETIGMLPPQLQQQPPEMLIPIAIDQLVMRELVLQKAEEAGLEEDQEVTALISDATEQARENAMVQVWLDRELGGAVTDAAVNQTYGAIEAQLGAQAPALEQIRPQIEQELRRQAFVDLSAQLQSNADVILYGPDGEPLAQ